LKGPSSPIESCRFLCLFVTVAIGPHLHCCRTVAKVTPHVLCTIQWSYGRSFIISGSIVS